MKNHTIVTRITDKEKGIIDTRCAQENYNTSEYIRYLIRKDKRNIKSRRSPL